MKHNYKPRTAKCRVCEYDNAVEPNQAMTVKQMMVAFTRGMDLPQRIGEYDGDSVDINDVGYKVPDRLDAVDFINATNQRAALAKRNAEQAKAEMEATQTIVENSSNE